MNYPPRPANQLENARIQQKTIGITAGYYSLERATLSQSGQSSRKTQRKKLTEQTQFLHPPATRDSLAEPLANDCDTRFVGPRPTPRTLPIYMFFPLFPGAPRWPNRPASTPPIGQGQSPRT